MNGKILTTKEIRLKVVHSAYISPVKLRRKKYLILYQVEESSAGSSYQACYQK